MYIYFLEFGQYFSGKIEENNDKAVFGMRPRLNEVDDMVIFLKMILTQTHHFIVIF